MSDSRVFIDTSVVCYLFGSDPTKADRVNEVLRKGGYISTQVLCEITNVARKKAKLDWVAIDHIIELICHSFEVKPLTLDIFKSAKSIARDHHIHIYDAQIIAAALKSEAAILMSEDMQNGRLFEGRLTILNPFL